MKIIRNNVIPFKGVRSDKPLRRAVHTRRHGGNVAPDKP